MRSDVLKEGYVHSNNFSLKQISFSIKALKYKSN